MFERTLPSTTTEEESMDESKIHVRTPIGEVLIRNAALDL
jgi:hypothetical protein